MQNITIHRWSKHESPVYEGCVRPADFKWLLLLRRDGSPPELRTDLDREQVRSFNARRAQEVL